MRATNHQIEASSTKTTAVRIALALGVTAALAGCGPELLDGTIDTQEEAGLGSINGLTSLNGLTSVNGLASINGLASVNGLSSINGLASVNGLSSVNGLMTTTGGRTTVAYVVRCALPAGRTLVK